MNIKRCIFCGGELTSRFQPPDLMHCPDCGDIPVTDEAFRRVGEPLGRKALEELRQRALGWPDCGPIQRIDIAPYLG